MTMNRRSPGSDKRDGVEKNRGDGSVKTTSFKPASIKQTGLHLSSLFEAAELVDHTIRDLLDSMDRQIVAIKSANLEKLEELTESYSSILAQFKQQEEQLIQEMSRAYNRVRRDATDTKTPAKATASSVRLRELATLIPESEAQINNWRSQLERGVKKLALKQQQLTSLLEFAVDQNSQLMSSIYYLSNRDSSHYGPDGRASGVKPGSAVNHRV